MRPLGSSFCLLVTCCLLLCACGCQAASPSSAKRTTGEVLADLRSLEVRSPAPDDEVDGLMALLRREMNEPSAASFGMAGGPIDSGYVQSVLLGSLRAYVDKQGASEAVKACLKSRMASLTQDKPMGDRIKVLLGNAGDRTVTPALIEILGNHEDGFMRFAAAHALGSLGDRSAIPVLKRSLSVDTYARVRAGASYHRLTPRQMVYSPVRLAAAEVLRSMGESVPVDAELVEPKYVIPRVEPLLYTGRTPYGELMMLGNLACPEAEAAIQRYIDAKKAAGASSDLIAYAQDQLDRSNAARSQDSSE